MTAKGKEGEKERNCLKNMCLFCKKIVYCLMLVFLFKLLQWFELHDDAIHLFLDFIRKTFVFKFYSEFHLHLSVKLKKHSMDFLWSWRDKDSVMNQMVQMDSFVVLFF